MADVLNGEEFATLLHTQKNGRFNGGDAVTASLAERGYLKNIGQPSWVHEPYYMLTEKGREFLRAFQNPNKLPLTQSANESDDAVCYCGDLMRDHHQGSSCTSPKEMPRDPE